MSSSANNAGVSDMALPQPVSSHDRNDVTEDEYLAFEQESEGKHEFSDGEIIAMTGASSNYSIITINTSYRLYDQLMQESCIVHSSDMRVQVNKASAYRYPDVTIVCGEPDFADTTPESLKNPTVLIEVLSESTQMIDRGKKLWEYRQIESLQEYVIIWQDTPRVERYLRHEDGEWLYKDVSDLEASLELLSIDCVLELQDVYRRVEFDMPDDEAIEDETDDEQNTSEAT
jgi:Uma2 family endonuclease